MKTYRLTVTDEEGTVIYVREGCVLSADRDALENEVEENDPVFDEIDPFPTRDEIEYRIEEAEERRFEEQQKWGAIRRRIENA